MKKNFSSACCFLELCQFYGRNLHKLNYLGILWDVDVSKVTYSVGVEEGLTAGFGSGVQMKDGDQVKAFIDKTWYVQPDAKQINKNVRLHKK